MRLRIPAWSRDTRLQANFTPVPERPVAGSYLEIRRRWKAGDAVALKFDFGLRAVAGANEAAGKVSLYRGPLLLAWDQAANAFDADRIPAVDLARLTEAVVSIPTNSVLASIRPPGCKWNCRRGRGPCCAWWTLPAREPPARPTDPGCQRPCRRRRRHSRSIRATASESGPAPSRSNGVERER